MELRNEFGAKVIDIAPSQRERVVNILKQHGRNYGKTAAQYSASDVEQMAKQNPDSLIAIAVNHVKKVEGETDIREALYVRSICSNGVKMPFATYTEYQAEIVKISAKSSKLSYKKRSFLIIFDEKFSALEAKVLEQVTLIRPLFEGCLNT
jgi:hypothetical protein